MKRLLSLSFASIIFFSCITNKQSTNFTNEVEKWKKELTLNGEVGPECDGNVQKWSENNPNYHIGFQEVKSSKYDVNGDGIKDELHFFTPVNCSGGSGHNSDYGLLIYSNEAEILTNKNLTENLKDKIFLKLSDLGYYDISFTTISYKDLTNTINGTFQTWVNEDARCCPRLNGDFEYNPLSFKIKIKYTDESKK